VDLLSFVRFNLLATAFLDPSVHSSLFSLMALVLVLVCSAVICNSAFVGDLSLRGIITSIRFCWFISTLIYMI